MRLTVSPSARVLYALTRRLIIRAHTIFRQRAWLAVHLNGALPLVFERGDQLVLLDASQHAHVPRPVEEHRAQILGAWRGSVGWRSVALSPRWGCQQPADGDDECERDLRPSCVRSKGRRDHLLLHNGLRKQLFRGKLWPPCQALSSGFWASGVAAKLEEKTHNPLFEEALYEALAFGGGGGVCARAAGGFAERGTARADPAGAVPRAYLHERVRDAAEDQRAPRAHHGLPHALERFGVGEHRAGRHDQPELRVARRDAAGAGRTGADEFRQHRQRGSAHAQGVERRADAVPQRPVHPKEFGAVRLFSGGGRRGEGLHPDSRQRARPRVARGARARAVHWRDHTAGAGAADRYRRGHSGRSRARAGQSRHEPERGGFSLAGGRDDARGQEYGPDAHRLRRVRVEVTSVAIYFWNASRSLNSTMMNSAAGPMFSGWWTLPSLQPRAPAGTEAGSVVPSGMVKLKIWSVRKITQPGKWRCMIDFSPGPYLTRRKRATSFSNDTE